MYKSTGAVCTKADGKNKLSEIAKWRIFLFLLRKSCFIYNILFEDPELTQYYSVCLHNHGKYRMHKLFFVTISQAA